MTSEYHLLDDLTRRSQQGDRNAFAELCELRRRRLVAEIHGKIDRRLLPRVDASDVIQEVFLDANIRLAEVASNGTPLLAWLRFLCNQKIIDLQRHHIGVKKRSVQRERIQNEAHLALDSIANLLVANITSPSAGACKNELSSKVREMLADLAPLDREILVLRHFEHLSNSEVAESLGLSINAASNRYVRALKKFKKVIDQNQVTP